MKIGKKTMKRGGESGSKFYEINLNNLEDPIALERVNAEKAKVDEAKKEASSQYVTYLWENKGLNWLNFYTKGGSKRKSKKSKKTKKGRCAHEGGKKKCPKHSRRKTSRTRKGLKHRKN